MVIMQFRDMWRKKCYQLPLPLFSPQAIAALGTCGLRCTLFRAQRTSSMAAVSPWDWWCSHWQPCRLLRWAGLGTGSMGGRDLGMETWMGGAWEWKHGLLFLYGSLVPSRTREKIHLAETALSYESCYDVVCILHDFVK